MNVNVDCRIMIWSHERVLARISMAVIGGDASPACANSLFSEATPALGVRCQPGSRTSPLALSSARALQSACEYIT